MREIILDTETTGLDPTTGDRIVEIGCLEILNSIPSGQQFHVYLDPQRDVPPEAFRVHGLSREFLTGKPLFEHVVDEFLTFVGDAKLVAHNAEFDMRFINAELARTGRPALGMDRVVDSLAIARKRHPGASNSLDALCQRYRIDNAKRTKHGALLDAEILAEVYAELLGGRQTVMSLQVETVSEVRAIFRTAIERPAPLPPTAQATELEAHASFVAQIGGKAIWNTFQS